MPHQVAVLMAAFNAEKTIAQAVNSLVMLERLVAIPSVADRPDQLQAVIDYAERYARDISGLHIHRTDSAGKPSMSSAGRAASARPLVAMAHFTCRSVR